MGRVYRVFVINIDGLREKMVAARSKKDAAALFCVNRDYMKRYSSETMNEESRIVALKCPGRVYCRMIEFPRKEWRPV